MLQLQLLVLITARRDIVVSPVESISHVVIALAQARTVANSVGDDRAIWLDKIYLYKEKRDLLARKVDSMCRYNTYLCRIVAPADFPHTVRRLAVRLDEVRNPDDFVLLVVLDHIRLLDNGDKVFGVANLPLQTLPDLFRPGLLACEVAQRTTIIMLRRCSFATDNDLKKGKTRESLQSDLLT